MIKLLRDRVLAWLESQAGGLIGGLSGWLYPLAAVLLLAGGFGAGWTVQGWHLGERIAGIERDHVAAAQQAEAAARKAEAALQAQVAAIDKDKTEEVEDAREQNRRLAAAVAAGDRRLRVQVRSACPGGVPQPANGAGLGAVAAAELGPDARQAYLALRAGLIETEGRLSACQGILRQLAPRAKG